MNVYIVTRWGVVVGVFLSPERATSMVMCSPSLLG